MLEKILPPPPHPHHNHHQFNVIVENMHELELPTLKKGGRGRQEQFPTRYDLGRVEKATISDNGQERFVMCRSTEFYRDMFCIYWYEEHFYHYISSCRNVNINV